MTRVARWKVVTCASPVDVAHRVANIVGDVVAWGERVLGVATGATPMPTYAELVRRHRRGTIDLRHCHLVLLDEYVGMSTYRDTIVRVLARPLDIPESNVLSPGGSAPSRTGIDTTTIAAAFEHEIVGLGGVALQILGIGRNGHIGFNEPGTPFDSRTGIAELSETTRADNAHHFTGAGGVPTHAVTQGIATILAARRIVLIATGDHKREIIGRLADGETGTHLPASALHHHDDVTIVVDAAAAADLR